MTSDCYRVVFYGEIDGRNNVEEVENNLASLFKLKDDQVKRIFTGEPYVVKGNVDYVTASKYKTAFERAGAICQVEPIKNCVSKTSDGQVSGENIPSTTERNMICPKCGASQRKSDNCLHCGVIIAKVRPKENLDEQPQIAVENTSGIKNNGAVPEGIEGWSWGAFLLAPIWSIVNRTWIGLLSCIPYAGIIMVFVLGAKGKGWAWKNKRWKSVEHFNEVQRKWSKWGVGIHATVISVGILAAVFIPQFLGHITNAGEDHGDIVVSALLAANDGDFAEADSYVVEPDSSAFMNSAFGSLTGEQKNRWHNYTKNGTIENISTTKTMVGFNGTFHFYDVTIEYEDGSVGVLKDIAVQTIGEDWKMSFVKFDPDRISDKKFVKGKRNSEKAHSKQLSLLEASKRQQEKIQNRIQKQQQLFEAEQKCSQGDEKACRLFHSLLDSYN